MPDAKIIFDQPKKIEGYFFISPISVNGSSPKTALLDKATVLNAKGDLFIILIFIGNDFKIQSSGVLTVLH